MATRDRVIGSGKVDGHLSAAEVKQTVREGLAQLTVDGGRVLVLIPDRTRTMPLPAVFPLIVEALGPRVAALDFLVALGTHPPLSDQQLGQLIGQVVVNGQCGRSRIMNHQWERPETFVTIGTLAASEVRELTEGRLEHDVEVALNRLILDYDYILVCGPVFPHEVVGFSGGTKYLFPGIAGAAIINFTHWLGALIGSAEMIGTRDTPVRAVIDRAASLVETPVSLLAAVVTHDGMAGLFCGPVQPTWAAAAALSAHRHIVWLDRPVQRALAVMPRMYDDLWTAAKGMYKLEPAIADGGEVVIFAPHLDEVSYVHGRLIDEIGYHCRDYFLAQWDRFKQYPGGVLAHSTHLKGRGTYDARTRRETPRIAVTLATGIPPERCARVNLSYRDPATIDPASWQGGEGDAALLVPHAGELLYRVGRPPSLSGVAS